MQPADKQCNHCKQTKSADDYNRRSGDTHLLQTYCIAYTKLRRQLKKAGKLTTTRQGNTSERVKHRIIKIIDALLDNGKPMTKSAINKATSLSYTQIENILTRSNTGCLFDRAKLDGEKMRYKLSAKGHCFSAENPLFIFETIENNQQSLLFDFYKITQARCSPLAA